MSYNPYQSPMGQPGGMFPQLPPTGDARQKVGPPAITLMVIAGIAIAWQLLSVGLNLFGVGLGAMAANNNNGGGGPPAAQMMMHGGISIAVGLLGVVIQGVILAGAVKMQKLESYGLAMTAAILSMLPCSICCLVGMPVGIWALVVLNDPYVKNSFR